MSFGGTGSTREYTKPVWLVARYPPALNIPQAINKEKYTRCYVVIPGFR